MTAPGGRAAQGLAWVVVIALAIWLVGTAGFWAVAIAAWQLVSGGA